MTRQELNQAIPVTAGVPEGARHATRKRIAKAVRAGVVVRLLPPAEHRAGYDAIADNRRKKGRMLSMSWDEIQAMQATFPGQVHLFGAEQAGQVIAAAIAMAVNPRVLSVYAWGERAGAEAVTPVSLLAQALYGFARQHGFALLDLGTSSVQGVVDPGLLAFKASLGATPSLKLWLERTLA